MIKTVLYAIIFWVFMLISPLFFIPHFFLRILGLEEQRRKYAALITTVSSKFVLWLCGADVTVRGLENMPEKRRDICYICNHQGYADIPLLIGYLPIKMGFIAKREIMFVPFFHIWMRSIKCIYINRKSHKSAIESIKRGVESIKNGNPMYIAPEGRRSKSSNMGKFHPGSLKLAIRSNALIIPVTIDGSYKLFEEKGLISSAKVFLTIHKSIDTALLSPEEKKGLSNRLWKIINSSLKRSP